MYIANGKYELSEFYEAISMLDEIKLDSIYKQIELAKTHEILNKKLEIARKNTTSWYQYKALNNAVFRSIYSEPLDQLRRMNDRADKLLESTSRLDYSNYEQTIQNKLAIEKCLITHLSQQYDDVSPLPLINNAIVDAELNRIVQWDSILECTDKDDNLSIYFITINEIPHTIHITDTTSSTDRRLYDLQSKIHLTEKYFIDLQHINDSGRKRHFTSQNRFLRPYITRKRVYVYGSSSSSSMSDDIIGRFDSLSLAHVDDRVTFAYAQCEDSSECIFTEVQGKALAHPFLNTTEE